MLGGIGEYKQILLLIPVGSIPTIWMLPLNLFVIGLYGKMLFEKPTDIFGFTNMSLGMYFLTNLVLMGLGIYGTVILSKGLGLVHNFSAWRGFGTIMLFVLFLFIIVVIISIIIGILMFAILGQ